MGDGEEALAGLYLATSGSVVRLDLASGAIEPAFAAIPTEEGWDDDVTASFDVLSGRREIVFNRVQSDVQPWLYSDLK